MSDSIKEVKRVAKVLAKEYNKINNSNYSWATDEKCFEPGEPFDFRLFDSDKSLSVQMTRGVADPKREYILPDWSGKVISNLKSSFKEKGYKELQIYINFHKPPANSEEVKELSYWLEWVIEHRISEEPTIFSWESSFQVYLDKVKGFVSDITVKRGARDTEPIFIYGWSGKKMNSWPSPEFFIPEAVKKKENLYEGNVKNIVLAVLSGPFPLTDSDYYVKTIAGLLEHSNFKEIWLIDDFQSQSCAKRIK